MDILNIGCCIMRQITNIAIEFLHLHYVIIISRVHSALLHTNYTLGIYMYLRTKQDQKLFVRHVRVIMVNIAQLNAI